MSSMELPGINSLVEIVLPDGRIYPSRIEDAEGLIITVAAPRGVGDLDIPRIGAGVELRWTGLRGLYSAPGTLTDLQHGIVSLWKVETDGKVSVGNRRSAARAAADDPIRLIDPDEGHDLFTGRLVDISEHGARCKGKGPGLTAEQKVLARLELEDRTLNVPGDVLTVGRAVEGGENVVVVFEPAEPDAEVIRRHVLRAQIKARKAAAGG